MLAHKFQTDCLILTIPTREDITTIGRSSFSPTTVTLAEALLVGAGNVLQLEPGELAAFVRKNPEGVTGDQLVFYETVPGGAGYLEEMAERLSEVAAAAIERLYGHNCVKACYLYLKHYRNQYWHPFFNKDLIRDILVILSQQEKVIPQKAEYGTSMETLQYMLKNRVRYPKGEIEEPLRAALYRAGIPEGIRDFEVRDEHGRLVTVPDFTWPDVKLAVFCDSFAIHGNPETLELDAKKRNFLQSQGWAVLTYWGKTILKSPEACARQVAELYRQRAEASWQRKVNSA